MRITLSILALALLSMPAAADELGDLQQATQQANPQENIQPRVSLENTEWRGMADAMAPAPAPAQKVCAETVSVMFGKRYAISKDKATGQPCKLYDLAFPSI